MTAIRIMIRRTKRAFQSLYRLYTEQKVRVHNLDINTIRNGEGNKHLLLIPSTLGSAWTDFRPQIEKLPALLPDFTVTAWDPPGCGKSIPPERKFGLDMFQNDANCAIDLMQTLDCGNFSILGWNSGGITALMITGRFPQFVDKLVIWGTSAYVTEDDMKLVERKASVKRLSNDIRKPMEQLYGPERFAEMCNCWENVILAFAKERKGDYCKTEVDCIQSPTLILHGSRDTQIAAEHAAYLAKHIKYSEYLEIPNGEHNMHLNSVDEFNNAVTKFLLKTPK